MTVQTISLFTGWYESRRPASRIASPVLIMIALMCLAVFPAAAQESDTQSSQEEDTQSSQEDETQSTQEDVVVLETVEVTGATKRGAVPVMEVPAAISIFGHMRLDALNFDDLSSLSYTMPNVQLDDIGTIPGVANFSIRGLGINSSIPSIDPTVGVFVDGVYIGIPAGVLFDTFDIQSIQVLRGPQGVLFGRNVTGGAILITTRPPTDEFNFDANLSVETGLKTSADATVRGPLMEGVLSGKLALYRSHDEGWFTNEFNGEPLGGGDTRIARAALKFTPTDNFYTTIRFEDGNIDGEGVASQNLALFDTDTHNVTSNAEQYDDHDWTQLFTDSKWNVDFGNGVITHIFGWREYSARALSDIDSTNFSSFHARVAIEQEQTSNELRYAGTFGNVDITSGVYSFQQDLLYIEERQIDVTPPFDGNPPTVVLVGGGDGHTETRAVFMGADWHLNEAWTLNLGARYTKEETDADVARVRPGGGSVENVSINPDFPNLSIEDTAFTPKIGFQWQPAGNTHIYGFWTKGYRSGGFNFRHTALDIPVTPFEPEEQRSIEFGLKQELPELDARFAVAVFRNEIENLQRESNDPDSSSAVQQIIRNVGTATVKGFEASGQVSLGNGFALSAFLGYLSGEYEEIVLDLSGDGVIDEQDFALELPRLSPWTYGVSLFHNMPLGPGQLYSRISFNHRDESFFSDNNLGVLNESDQLSANFSYALNRHWAFSLYGNNLLNETTWGGDTLLPNVFPFGGDGAGPKPRPAFRPLAKGRVIGLEVSYVY